MNWPPDPDRGRQDVYREADSVDGVRELGEQRSHWRGVIGEESLDRSHWTGVVALLGQLPLRRTLLGERDRPFECIG